MPTNAEASGNQQQASGQETPKSEWIVAGVSLLLVVGAIAFLIYDAVTSPAMPPDIRVSVDSVLSGHANYIVRYTARNLGGSTGAQVQISGELRAKNDTTTVERSVATVDFIPANSIRKGGLFFTHDPGQYRLVVRAEGFSAP